MNSAHKGPVTRKTSPFDYLIIMTYIAFEYLSVCMHIQLVYYIMFVIIVFITWGHLFVVVFSSSYSTNQLDLSNPCPMWQNSSHLPRSSQANILWPLLITVKPVCNDHLYNEIYFLWFIQWCFLMVTEGTNLLVLTISAFWSSSRWPLAT